MKCFNHTEIDAVGVCKNCQKGVCMDCLSEVHNGIACKDSCADEVKLINKIMDHNQRVIGNGQALLRNGIIYSVMGGAMLYMALVVLEEPPFAIGGAVFLFLGLYSLLRYRTHLQSKKPPEDTIDF